MRHVHACDLHNRTTVNSKHQKRRWIFIQRFTSTRVEWISKLSCSLYQKNIFKLLYIFTRFPELADDYFYLSERYPRYEGAPLKNITCTHDV